MQNRPQKSVFFPKITQSFTSQEILIKKEQIVKSLQSEFTRNSYFYRSQHSKTTESKKCKKDRPILELENKPDSVQKISPESNTKIVKKKNNLVQNISINHSESVPINIKQKFIYANIQTKRKGQPKKKLKVIEEPSVSNHFCFSIVNNHHKKYYRSKHKQAKVKTQCQQMPCAQSETILQDRRIMEALKVRKAAQFEYLPQQSFQRKQREHRIRECLNALQKVKQKKDAYMQITSIKGWNSKFDTTLDCFI